ncbi:MAG TPA: hypothetical protein VGK33_13550 [Chloroflexota bacterium]
MGTDELGRDVLSRMMYAARPALSAGLAITIVVVGMNFFADGLQDALDPYRLRTRA